MVIKFKVSDVAKDFGKNNKDIINILSEYCDGPAKKANTVLEENELNILFDKLTADNSVESLDNYFNSAKNQIRKRQKTVRMSPLMFLRITRKKRTKIKNIKIKPLFFKWQSKRLKEQRKRPRKRLIKLRRQELKAKQGMLIHV